MAKIKPEFDKRNVKIIGLSVDRPGSTSSGRTTSRRPRGSRPTIPSSATATSTSRSCTGCCPRPRVTRRTGRQLITRRFATCLSSARTRGEADPHLPDDDRPQLRRGSPGDRLAPAHGQAPGRHAGQLEVGRGRDHRRAVSDDEAKTIYPEGWKAPRPYIRIVPQPSEHLGTESYGRSSPLLAGRGSCRLVVAGSWRCHTSSCAPSACSTVPVTRLSLIRKLTAWAISSAARFSARAAGRPGQPAGPASPPVTPAGPRPACPPSRGTRR